PLSLHDALPISGLGVAAGVERSDGRIAWVSSYRQQEIPRAWRWHETKDREVTWWPSPVTATAAAVIMAPPDSPDLVAFDPASGRPAWTLFQLKDPQRRDYRWYLGAVGGRAYVLGTKLSAVEVATGDLLW